MSSRKRRCSLEMPQGASGLYTGWTPVIAYVSKVILLTFTAMSIETPQHLSAFCSSDSGSVELREHDHRSPRASPLSLYRPFAQI